MLRPRTHGHAPFIGQVQAEGTTSTDREKVDVEPRVFLHLDIFNGAKGESQAKCMVGAMLDSRTGLILLA